MSKKVLLFYITVSSGHHRASIAIENALKLLEPGTETMCVNSFNYTNPILEKIINKTYNSIIKRTPEVWEYLYDNPKVVKNTQRLKETMHKHGSKKLKKLIDDFKPDVVVATQAFPCGIVADLKKTFDVNIPLVGVLTDFAPHSYWMYEAVNKYTVASEEAKQRFVHDGIPESKIEIMGIPIDAKFSKPLEKQKIKEKLGLNDNKPVALVMGGGQGLGPIKGIVAALEKVDLGMHILVAAGINTGLHKYLIRKSKRYKQNLIPFGYTDKIDELMEASDILITKPGGITVSEALAKALPILIINPIPGQEAKNTHFLTKAGAAVKAENTEDLVVLLENLFSSPSKLEAMSKAANEISNPESALNVAKMVLRF